MAQSHLECKDNQIILESKIIFKNSKYFKFINICTRDTSVAHFWEYTK